MKFRLAVLGLLALLFALPDCCSTRGARDPRIEDRAAYVDKLVHETVALVAFYDDDGDQVTPDTKDAEMKPYCAAVWVDKNTFLTAYHCIEDLRPEGSPALDQAEKELNELLGLPTPGSPLDAKAFYATRDDVNDGAVEKRMYREAKVISIDEDHDLACVRDVSNDVPRHPFAPLASDVRVGEDLDILGMPARTWWAYTHGWVQNMLPSFELHGGKMTMVQVQAPVFYGNSGGPAFNAAGQLVGISSRLATRVPDRAFYVALPHLDAFLRKSGVR